MQEPSAPTTWHVALPHGATAVPIARAMVRTALQDLRATADRTTAQLLTAELVANALKHARATTPVELVVRTSPAGCRVEVHDGDPALVEGLGAPDPDPVSLDTGPRRIDGRRGLLLVRSLSSASGCRPTKGGKAVWFTLPEMPRVRRR
ncbi:ATP-binding protein [Streptomyces sp. NPDC048506]|uniref:ATP-binding protein n=1 Tax=Streptomyces sp. NPDC048506 TaxID=3155028 RepID=UPI003433C79C